MITIDSDRLLDDLRSLRRFGAYGTGVVRRSLSPIDIESRHWLVERMRAAGLDAGIDGIGTVVGRSDRSRRSLLIGSHTDTQPEGGWLDGALGVIYGLEVARALAESDLDDELGVDVASWIDEEGTFSSLLGSRIYCGEADDEVLDSLSNDAGLSLREALAAARLDGRPWQCLEPERYVGYLEAHIEQGPYLEEDGQRIGVVTGIVGIRAFDIQFEGQQNHAGTTPMARRRDAVSALIKLANAINTQFPALAGPRTVWTIGALGAEPGATSIVPGRARMSLQFRDADESRLAGLEAHFLQLVGEANDEGRVKVTTRATSCLAPAIMDAGLRRHLEASAATHCANAWTAMPSAAGHDAQVLARHLPSAMLFIPSIGGVSHSFEEDSGDDDIVLGCQVLASAAAGILKSAL